MNSSGLDEKDREILTILKNNARMSYSEIGEKVGLTRVAVRNRMDAMEKSGVIIGYQTITDEKKAQEGMEFYMSISVRPEDCGDVADRLAKQPVIRKLMIATGNTELLTWGYAPDYRQLRKFIDEFYYSNKGVLRIEFKTVLSVLKDIDGGVDYVRQNSRNLDREEKRGSESGN